MWSWTASAWSACLGYSESLFDSKTHWSTLVQGKCQNSFDIFIVSSQNPRSVGQKAAVWGNVSSAQVDVPLSVPETLTCDVISSCTRVRLSGAERDARPATSIAHCFLVTMVIRGTPWRSEPRRFIAHSPRRTTSHILAPCCMSPWNIWLPSAVPRI